MTLVFTLVSASSTAGIHRKKKWTSYPDFLTLLTRLRWPAGKSCFKAEALAAFCSELDLFEHQPPGAQGSGFGPEW